MKNKRTFIGCLLAALLLALAVGPGLAEGPQPPTPEEGVGLLAAAAAPLGTGFTYQGQLKRDGSPVTDTCDFQFGLYDTASLGVQLGVTQTVSSVSVADGLFTVQLNDGGQFGASAFNGEARWLAIAVRCPAGSDNYTGLGRQALTAAPYALYSNSTGALQGYAVVPNQPPSNGQVLKWNASGWAPASDDKSPYVRTVIVSPIGDEYANGQALMDALSRISGATATNPYLLKIEPGVYNLGTAALQMKEYVDIEGSGEGVTIITAAGSATSNGTVRGANNAELRFLTVRNTGGNDHAFAIYNYYASPRLTQVTAIASGGTINNIAVFNLGSSSAMTHVTARAVGNTYLNYGVANNDSYPAMTHVTIDAADGTTNYGLYNHNSAPERMVDGYVTVWGGSQSFGVFNDDSAIYIQNSRISVGDAATANIGVLNHTTSVGGKVQIDNCKITVSYGSSGYAIYNDPGYDTAVGASHLGGGQFTPARAPAP